MISIDYEIFVPCLMSLDMLQCLLVYSLWELEQNLYPAIVWNYINLNYAELFLVLFRSTIFFYFFVYSSYYFWEIDIETPTKNIKFSYFKLTVMYSEVVKVTQSCQTLCNTVHGIIQARILGYYPFSRGSSPPRDQTQVSCIAGRLFISWATREAQEYWGG